MINNFISYPTGIAIGIGIGHTCKYNIMTTAFLSGLSIISADFVTEDLKKEGFKASCKTAVLWTAIFIPTFLGMKKYCLSSISERLPPDSFLLKTVNISLHSLSFRDVKEFAIGFFALNIGL